jgi:hypothetical protein
MARDDAEDTTIYKVVINHEEQYSIWPAEREPPLGWKEVGKQGLRPNAWPTSRMSGPICDRSVCGKKWPRDGTWVGERSAFLSLVLCATDAVLTK